MVPGNESSRERKFLGARVTVTLGLTSPSEPARSAQIGRAIWTYASRPARFGAMSLDLILVTRLRWGLVWLGEDGSVWCLMKISVKSLTYTAPAYTSLHMHTLHAVWRTRLRVRSH